MADPKPLTPWAPAGLVCSILGCLGAAVWLNSIAGPPVETTGVGAGLAILMVAIPSGLLCLLGALFGAVAWDKVHGGGWRGKGMARAALVLGCLPYAVFALGYALDWWRFI
jgi:hypothetical protein